jgi:YD repeat-containing protein
MNLRRLALLLALAGVSALRAQTPTSFRYFHDSSNRLYSVLDSTGTLIQYTYDPSGNITQVTRSTLAPSQLSILNITPAYLIGGSTITITGQNFSTTAAANTVTIGGTTATVISATATQLVVLVPTTTYGGAVSVTVGGVTTSWSSTISVLQIPVFSISPVSGKKGTTITLTVVGQNLIGATFALKSLDPSYPAAGGAVNVVSNSGTTAVLTLVLGATEGEFALVGTNAAGPNAVTPASLFLIGPTVGAAGEDVSVLNTSFNPSNVQPLPTGQNSASFDVSVLNTASSPSSLQALPTGQNSATFDVSVLNTASSPSSLQALPTGQNSATFDVSVLNTASSPSSLQALPAGQNSAIFDASVLNTALNPNSLQALPAGQNSASYFISVCNTASGCTAIAPHLISVNASPVSSRPRPPDRSLPVPPSRDLPPVLEPLDKITSVTVGQTIRLGARNAEPGSTVEFDVNQTAIAKVSESPYETLFTVPEGQPELVFQAVVGGAGQPERVSQIARMTVVPDSGATISGSIAQGTAGVELSLAAGGLKAEFFHLEQPVTALPSLEGLQPARSGYVTAINEPNPGVVFGDDPLGAHLASDYAIRFSGAVLADDPGQYRFWLAARSGAAMLIDGKLMADSGFVSGEPSEAAISIALDRGYHSIEVIYYLAVGAASVQLDWQHPGVGRREVLGPEHLRTVLTGSTAVSAADGTFVFPQVPTKFDSVWIHAKQGNGFIEFPAIGPVAGPVSIAVPK